MASLATSTPRARCQNSSSRATILASAALLMLLRTPPLLGCGALSLLSGPLATSMKQYGSSQSGPPVCHGGVRSTVLAASVRREA